MFHVRSGLISYGQTPQMFILRGQRTDYWEISSLMSRDKRIIARLIPLRFQEVLSTGINKLQCTTLQSLYQVHFSDSPCIAGPLDRLRALITDLTTAARLIRIWSRIGVRSRLLQSAYNLSGISLDRDMGQRSSRRTSLHHSLKIKIDYFYYASCYGYA